MVTKRVVQEWEAGLHALHGWIGRRFKRAEPRERMYRYLRGVMSDVERKNGWQVAEQVGEERPYGMQRLLRTAVSEVDGVRDDLQLGLKAAAAAAARDLAQAG